MKTHEPAIGAAVSGNAEALQSAYAARAKALDQAYNSTDTAQIKAAVKAAWSGRL